MKRHYAACAVLITLNLSAAYAADPHTLHGPADDKRVVLLLTPGERIIILDEMRLLLDGVQKVTGTLGKQNMQATADAARNMGLKMVHELPPALHAKLPQEFRQLGFAVHGDFDQMALDAESLGDVSTSLNQLSATLQKCTNCHATYQIQTPASSNNH